MKKVLITASLTLLVISLLLPGISTAQQKQVKVKKITVENGKTVEVDTVFTIKEGESIKEYVSEFDAENKGDSLQIWTYNIEIESDSDIDKEQEIEHEIEILQDGEETKVFVFSNGEELEDIKIKLDGDFIVLAEELAKLECLKELEGLKQLKELKVLHTLEGLERLEALEKLEEFQNIEIVIPEFEDHAIWFQDDHSRNHVSEKEIRAAGIKVKEDRLVLENYNINIDNGMVEISFTTTTEATPKVTVYNFYGDKITSAKPALLDGEHNLTFDLSKKQHGTYYIQFETKDSSTIKKIKL